MERARTTTDARRVTIYPSRLNRALDRADEIAGALAPIAARGAPRTLPGPWPSSSFHIATASAAGAVGLEVVAAGPDADEVRGVRGPADPLGAPNSVISYSRWVVRPASLTVLA